MDELNLIPFVGALRGDILRKNGIKDIESLLKTSIDKLASLEGFSIKLAQKIRNYAAEIASLGLVGKEPIKELIFKEFHCPRCRSIVSSVEPTCHRCGNTFFAAPENIEQMIGNMIIEILKSPTDSNRWKKLARTLETLGLHNEAVVCMFKVDLLEMFGEKETVKMEKKIESRGFVDGNGVVFKGGNIGGLYQSIRAKIRTAIIFSILTLLILPLIIISSSLAIRGIEIDGYFGDWKIYEGINIYSEGGFVDKVKWQVGEITSIYLKLNTKLFVSPEKYYYTSLVLFIDTDLDNSTGYIINDIGADRIITILGSEGKITRAVSMEYDGDGIEWKWKKLQKIRAACDDDEIEIGIYKITRFYSFIVYKNVYNEYISGIFSTEPGVFCVIEDDEKNILLKNEEACIVRLYPTSLNSFSIRMNIFNAGNSSATFDVIDEVGNLVARGLQPMEFNLDKPKKFSIVYTGNGERYSTVYLSVNISGAKVYYKNYARGKYLEELPSHPIVDGIYADVLYVKDGEDCKNKDVDIMGGAIKSFNGRTIVSFGLYGNMMRGNYVPVGLFIDSDRDTIPDPLDSYPQDFNNDGVPDYKSKTSEGLPDVDKDGVGDYPFGDDRYLNTTVDGRPVSIRLGENVKIVGKVTIQIYLEGRTLLIEGFDGKLLNSTLSTNRIRYNSKYMELECEGESKSVSIFVRLKEHSDTFHLSEIKLNKHENAECEALILGSPIAPTYLGKFPSPLIKFGSDIYIDTDGGDALRPSIAQTSDKKLWVVYEEYFNGNYYICFANSTDNGKSWNLFCFYRKPMIDHCYPVIAVDSNDYVYIFFENRTTNSFFEFLRFNKTGWYIFYISSWTWWNNVRNISVCSYQNVLWVAYEYIFSANDYDIGALLGIQPLWRRLSISDSIEMEKHPCVAVSSTRAVICYQVYDRKSYTWNISIKYSDGVVGYNFSYSNFDGNVYLRDDLNAWIHSVGNTVWIVWEALYSAFDSDIRFAVSTDGGINFGIPSQFSYSTDNEKYPTITISKDNPNNILIVYMNCTPTPPRICAAESKDGGSSWKILIISDVSNWIPVTTYRSAHVTNGRYGSYVYFYVVWSGEYTPTDRDILFDRYTVNEFYYYSYLLIVFLCAFSILLKERDK